jgi:hypothetical protein
LGCGCQAQLRDGNAGWLQIGTAVGRRCRREEAIGQRILRKKFSSLAKDPRFFSFLREEGHHLINEDETLVAQLPLTKTG